MFLLCEIDLLKQDLYLNPNSNSPRSHSAAGLRSVLPRSLNHFSRNSSRLPQTIHVDLTVANGCHQYEPKH